MPIYYFWGADEFRLKKAVRDLCDRNLDPTWASFNYDKIPAEQGDNGIMSALNQAMSSPFGMGKRIVWLEETPLAQRCSEPVLKELERTLGEIPDTTLLLFTSTNKPDGRIKSTKLLQKHADVREFSPIPGWKTEDIVNQVYQVAKELNIRLQPKSAELLGEAVGGDTRRLYNELEKLSIYWSDQTPNHPTEPLPPEAIAALVSTSTQNSLQLAEALLNADIAKSLSLVTDLLNQNEPALRMVATLVGQFRTWLWVKLLSDAGERDPKVIADAAEIGNPKRVYFLQKSIRSVTLNQLKAAMEILLSLEFSLKQGAPEQVTLHTKLIELAHCFRSPQPSR
jgi:DNA polymerase III subunit delta